jgi:AcrR family transcriptional regulator
MKTNRRASSGSTAESRVPLESVATGALSAPLDNPLSDLSDTARSILQAALKLLGSEGYSAMSLQRVARLAGVNKSTVIYTFGNKAGLVSAVVDAQVHDINARLSSLTASNPSSRLHTAIEGMGALVEATEHLRGYFDILPRAFREPELRDRLWSLYKQWFGEYLGWFGLSREEAAGDEADVLMGLAQLIVAIPDGLSIQAELGGEEFDVRGPLAAFEFLLRSAMSELQAMEGHQVE